MSSSVALVLTLLLHSPPSQCRFPIKKTHVQALKGGGRAAVEPQESLKRPPYVIAPLPSLGAGRVRVALRGTRAGPACVPPYLRTPALT